MLLCVDAGLRACGCSVWHRHSNGDHSLVRAALVHPYQSDFAQPRAWIEMAAAVARYAPPAEIGLVVVEQPGTRRGDGRHNRKALESLVAVGAAIIAQYPNAYPSCILPLDWAGNLKRPNPWREDEDPIAHRVRKTLNPEELQQVEWPAPYLRHNVYDALGIGLKVGGRFARKRYTGKGIVG
jgi:hypothetical protein